MKEESKNVFAQNGKSIEMQNQYWPAEKTDGRSKSWHGRVGGKDHYWLSQGASMRLMEESHQNTPENEIQMHKQKHPIYIASGFLKTSVGKLPKKMMQNNKTSKSAE